MGQEDKNQQKFWPQFWPSLLSAIGAGAISYFWGDITSLIMNIIGSPLGLYLFSAAIAVLVFWFVYTLRQKIQQLEDWVRAREEFEKSFHSFQIQKNLDRIENRAIDAQEHSRKLESKLGESVQKLRAEDKETSTAAKAKLLELAEMMESVLELSESRSKAIFKFFTKYQALIGEGITVDSDSTSLSRKIGSLGIEFGKEFTEVDSDKKAVYQRLSNFIDEHRDKGSGSGPLDSVVR